MPLRLLTKDDAEMFRAFRLQALKESPTSFSADYAEHEQRSVSEFATRIHTEPDNFIVGAFEADILVGIGGFYRTEGKKLRHKGNIWGMYVAPGGRRKGTGGAIMAEIVRRARSDGDIVQLLLTVGAWYDGARRLYQACGFQAYGREMRAMKVDGRYYDEELMALRL